MTPFLKYLGATCSFKSKKWGILTAESASFTSAIDGDLVIYMGESLNEYSIPLVRIHSECVFAEAFGSEFCDCAEQFNMAMEKLKKSRTGILFYLRIDGRGAGLSAKVKATELETNGMDTYDSRVNIGVPPDSRNYNQIGNFLAKKGIKSVILLTNNPEKIQGIESAGITVIPESLIIDSDNKNIRRLYQTKAKKFKHSIPDKYSSENLPSQLQIDFDGKNS